MDPTITTILQVGFGGVGAIIITKFFESWSAARQGKKEALDTLRESHNKYRRLFLDWRNDSYRVRAIAYRHGVPDEELGPTPKDEDD